SVSSGSGSASRNGWPASGFSAGRQTWTYRGDSIMSLPVSEKNDPSPPQAHGRGPARPRLATGTGSPAAHATGSARNRPRAVPVSLNVKVHCPGPSRGGDQVGAI